MENKAASLPYRAGCRSWTMVFLALPRFFGQDMITQSDYVSRWFKRCTL